MADKKISQLDTLETMADDDLVVVVDVSDTTQAATGTTKKTFKTQLKGDTGNGIASITLINTVGLVKTYRITYTDTTTFDYDVTDGTNGTNGTDGTNGTNGTDGADGVVQTVVAGTNVTVDSTDPANPVINVTGGDVTASSTTTFTNKTIDANGTGNSISNLEVADLATGVLDTDLSSVSATDNTIPSAKATKTALDLKAPLASPAFTGNVGVAKTADANVGIDVLNPNGKQGLRVENATETDIGFSTFKTADNFTRFAFLGDGKMEWGSGALVADTNLYRSAADTLKTDDNFVANNISAGATVSGTNTGDQTLPVKASGAEVDTGTDDAKFVTAKAAKDSHNVPSVAPGTTGNVLTSNGTDWTSAAPAASGSSLWTAITGTRTGNTTITVTGDQTAIFKKGMIVRWTESAADKVGMVSIPSTFSSVTTITIIGDTCASIDTNSFKYSALVGSEQFVARFAYAGTVGAVATNVMNAYYATEPMKVIGADLQAGTAGTTNSTTIDINKAGTTMFTTKPTLATTVATSPTPFTADTTSALALGDKVTIDVDAIQTTAAIDLYVQLYLFPTRFLTLS